MDLIQINSLKEKRITREKSSSTTFHPISNQNVSIWLADLTYTQQQISSESMPSAIGGVASYAEKKLNLKNPIQLFKYPEKLASSLEISFPDIIGFSNYMWNCSLSLTFAKRIKEISPKTITVMGGPNFPVSKIEQENFLREHTEIDFYIEGEGELAFTILASALINSNFDKKLMNNDIPSVKFISSNGKVILSNPVDRIKDLTEIPSPYANGKMDEFFDGKLQPVIQTTRGCPFSCTFCVEGSSYYSKVSRYNESKTFDELEYIGKKMKAIREIGGRNDLWIVDSNFGMYSQDLDTCKKISECQKKYGWPEYIQVDTGKNNKPRVLEAAKLVDGAIRLSGSVQTLDALVLENIKRSNISAPQLMELAQEASTIGADSRSEIILGLPGETLQSHFDTLKTIINSGFNHVNTYQLMMLPGTELSDNSTRKKYNMNTMYRVLPRCYSDYEISEKLYHISEIEEICVSTNTLPFDDYVKARLMHLIVHIFHNDKIFTEVINFLKYYNIEIFDWLLKIYEISANCSLTKLFNDFKNETKNELWNSKESLESEIHSTDIVSRYVKGELGYNLLFVYKTKSITENLSELFKLVESSLLELLKDNNIEFSQISNNLNDVLNYNYCRLENLFTEIDHKPIITISTDSLKIIHNSFNTLPNTDELKIQFLLNNDQKRIIENGISLYGKNHIGISRLLSKTFVTKLLREPILLG